MLALALMVACSHSDRHSVCLNMFAPNTDLTIDDVLEMGVDRIDGIDIDMFEFKRADTTITISFDMDSNSTFIGYDWVVPIPDDTPDTLFLDEMREKYSVRFNPEKRLAYCPKNRLVFLYSIGNIENEIQPGSRRCFVLKYEPYLLMF